MNYIKSVVCSEIIIFAVCAIVFVGDLFADSLTDCNSEVSDNIYSGCTELINQNVLDDPQLAIAYSRRSDVQIERYKYDEAITDRYKAMLLAPNNQSYKKRLADAYAYRGDRSVAESKYPSAISDYTEAIKLDVLNDGIYAKRSDAYLASGEMQRAIEDIKKAIQLRNDIPKYQEQLINLYDQQAKEQIQKDDYNGAITSYSKAIEINHSDPNLYVKRGLVFFAVKNNNKAEADFTTAIQLQPAHNVALLQRGKLYLARGDNEKAISDLTEVILHDALNINALLLRGVAYEDSKDRDKARHDYMEVLKVEKDNRDAIAGINRLDKENDNVVRLIQLELRRLGCDPGDIDGKWGDSSKTALMSFCSHADIELDDSEPNERLLQILKQHNDQVCSSTVGEQECKEYVAIGSDDKGIACLVNGHWQIQPKMSAQEGCFMFNGTQYCD